LTAGGSDGKHRVMKTIALASLLLALIGCKSGEKSGAAPTPTPSPAPVPAEADGKPEAKPEVKDEAPPEPAADEPANTLKAGAPVKKGWSEGGPGEVVWKLEGGGAVTLRAEAGKPEGVLLATYQGKQQHVTNFACNTTAADSDAEFTLTPEGKVLFRSTAGARGKKPGPANAFLLEWKPDKGTVFVAQSWQGTTAAEPPPWAKL
jgi:hypothetical protein